MFGLHTVRAKLLATFTGLVLAAGVVGYCGISASNTMAAQTNEYANNLMPSSRPHAAAGCLRHDAVRIGEGRLQGAAAKRR